MDSETQLLPRWVCPKHLGVELEQRDGMLRCNHSCRYPLINGIPRFTPSHYASAFGLQWRQYRKTQLDSHTGLPLSEERLRRCLGEELWEDLEGKTVLEVGCGAGRFTEILLKRGAHVMSIDLSDAVDANQENFPQNTRHQIAQADVRLMPFARSSFDIVLCLGVVQHTPSPEETLAKLWEMVKTGGCLVFDHYTYNLSHSTKTAPLFRMILKRLSPEAGLRVTNALVNALFPLHRAVRKIYPLQMLLSRLSPVQVYFHSYPSLSMQLQKEWALLDTHDTLTDWYKHFRTRRQLIKQLMLMEAGLVRCEYGGNGIEVRAQRPVPMQSPPMNPPST